MTKANTVSIKWQNLLGILLLVGLSPLHFWAKDESITSPDAINPISPIPLVSEPTQKPKEPIIELYDPKPVKIYRWQAHLSIGWYRYFTSQQFLLSESETLFGGSFKLGYKKRKFPEFYLKLLLLSQPRSASPDWLAGMVVGVDFSWQRKHWNPGVFIEMGYTITWVGSISQSLFDIQDGLLHGLDISLGGALLSWRGKRLRMGIAIPYISINSSLAHRYGLNGVMVSIKF